MININITKMLHTAHGAQELCIQTQVASGESLALYGKSGSGKTTLLRILAGLETPQSGSIEVGGVTWFDSQKGINLPPQKRGVGFVFQDYALFPNMSVKENLTFALKEKKNLQKVDEILKLMEIQNLADTKPARLSGGQKQRVALARSLVSEPKLLLLDEPLSALDLEMRHKLQSELIKIQEHFELTTVIVSHDIAEIIKLSKRVLELKNGQIISDTTPLLHFAKTQQKGEFEAVAEIIFIKNEDANSRLTLLCEGRLLELAFSAEVASTLSIGDKFLLSSDLINPHLQRITNDTSE